MSAAPEAKPYWREPDEPKSQEALREVNCQDGSIADGAQVVPRLAAFGGHIVLAQHVQAAASEALPPPAPESTSHLRPTNRNQATESSASKALGELRRQAESSTANERRVFARAHAGDTFAREALIEKYMPLAHYMARRFLGHSEPQEDLVQVASVGLIDAVDRFDISRPENFKTYAIPTILGHLRHHFRDKTWGLHVSRSLQERALKVRGVATLLEQHGRAWTAETLAEELGISEEAAAEAVQVWKSAYTLISLDSPSPGGDESVGTWGERINDETAQEELARALERIDLWEAIEQLPDIERRVVVLRIMGRTQLEIGETFRVSQMQVSRMLRRAIGRLQTDLS